MIIKKTKGKHFHNIELYAKRKAHTLFLNKKAASAVMSTLILTAGVIGMSIAVLYWTYAMGKVGNIEYAKSTTASSNAIEERLSYEYISYLSGTLKVYIVNWGKTDNVSIARVFILDSSYKSLGANSGTIILRNITDSTELQKNQLRLGQDGYFEMLIQNLHGNLFAGQIYNVRIVTSRGRIFDGSFSIQ